MDKILSTSWGEDKRGSDVDEIEDTWNRSHAQEEVPEEKSDPKQLSMF